MMKITVDFNDLARGGQVRVPLRRVEGTVAVGDVVIIHDPDAELECRATVMDIDLNAGRLYLAPMWEEESLDLSFPIGSLVFIWDGSRVAPLTNLAMNQAGGMTKKRTAPPLGPVATSHTLVGSL